MIRRFAAYLRERFSPAIFGPAIALHVWAAVWAAGVEPDPAIIAKGAGVAVLLILQFRLWDDLEDRDRDRAAHPERILVRSPAGPFRLALAALTFANLVLLTANGSPRALVGAAVLDLMFWLLYRHVRSHLTDWIWRFQILPLKYPAFVALIATTVGAPTVVRLGLAVVVAYAIACAYEALHDRPVAPGVTT